MDSAVCGLSALGFIYENSKGIGWLVFAAMLLISGLISLWIIYK
jgi:hypothetical protein